MTDNKKKVSKYKINELRITQEKSKITELLNAETSLSSLILNAVTAQTYSKSMMGEIGITEAVNVMSKKVNNVNDGNLNSMEATLTAQTVSLDTISNELARRLALNMGTNMQVT